jgi:RimJ/RimL family protein N-acetyltransferase
MSHAAPVTLREVEPPDLDVFYAQQLDREAIRMAAFVARDRTSKPAFLAHWTKILQSPRNINRTILSGDAVAGHIACFPHEADLEVTYWLGREFWGRGIATAALRQMLQLVPTRPILARAATDNAGSLRVLEKCGFTIIGEDTGYAHGREAHTDEYLLRLDAPHGCPA